MQRIKNLLSALALGCAIMAMPNTSGAISSATGPQPWGEFSFGDEGSFAASGLGFVPSDGGNSFYLDSPPWIFSGAGFLIVQDAFFPGDQFRVFDNNIAIGDTSIPTTSTTGCGSDPVDCFVDSRSSHGIFALGAGDHSFTIQMLLSPHFAQFGNGAAFFCIDSGRGECGVSLNGEHEVPEPESILLLALGFAGALYWLKRSQLSEVMVAIARKRQRR